MKNAKILFCFCLALGTGSLPVSAQNIFEQNKYDLESSSPAIRVAAVEYFKAQGSGAANNVLLERMNVEKNMGMKLRLIEAVDVNMSTGAFKAVAALLDDPNPYVAQSAAISLGRCSDAVTLIPVFEKALNNKKSAGRVKGSIVNALGFQTSADSVRLLDSVAVDTANPPEMRKLAVDTLGRMGTKEAAEKLKRYAADSKAADKGAPKKAAAKKKK